MSLEVSAPERLALPSAIRFRPDAWRLALVATALLLAPAPGCRPAPPYQKDLARGEALLRSDPVQARSHFERALSLGARVQGALGLALAEEALGHFDRALELLEQARQAAPDMLEVRLALARVRLARNERDLARSELEAVLASHPEQLSAVLLMAVLAESDQQVRRASELLDRWQMPSPSGSADAPLEVVVTRAELGRRLGRDPGREFRRAAQGSVPVFNPELARALAHAWLRTGRTEPALALLRALSFRAPSEPGVWTDLLRLELGRGDLATAEQTLRRAPSDVRRTADCLELEARLVSLRGQHQEAARLLGRAAEATPAGERKRRALLLFSRAEALILAGNDPAANQVLSTALDLDPGLTPARLARAALQVKDGRAAEAAQDLRQLVARHPQESKAHELLISALLLAGQAGAAREACRGYLALEPARADRHAFVATALARLGDTEGARRQYLAALQLEPAHLAALRGMVSLELPRTGADRVAGWLREQATKAGPHAPAVLELLGDFWSDQKQFAKAEAAYREATRHKARVAEPWAKLGRLLAHRGARDEAIEALETAISFGSRPDSTLLELLGQLEREAGRYAEARSVYERELSLRPGSLVALNNLAMLLAGPLGAPEEAVRLAERAYGKAPNSPAVADTLGWALVRRGRKQDMDRALELLELAASASRSPEVLYHLGKAHLLAAEPAEARRILERALAGGSEFEGAEDARATLDALRKQSQTR